MELAQRLTDEQLAAYTGWQIFVGPNEGNLTVTKADVLHLGVVGTCVSARILLKAYGIGSLEEAINTEVDWVRFHEPVRTHVSLSLDAIVDDDGNLTFEPRRGNPGAYVHRA